MAPKATWRPRDTHGRLTAAKERALPDSAFAFPGHRKGPLTGEAYVRDAISGFAQFDGVSDEERELAFENIRKAAAHYHVEMTETDWRQLGTRPLKPSYRPARS
jgi:hypothetical protein